jgi:hypothetical protein
MLSVPDIAALQSVSFSVMFIGVCAGFPCLWLWTIASHSLSAKSFLCKLESIAGLPVNPRYIIPINEATFL